jgi:hypothetical protein
MDSRSSSPIRWQRSELEDHRKAEHYTNREMAALIEAETGQRFKPDTISEHRAALRLNSPRRSDWSAPLRRWRPW